MPGRVMTACLIVLTLSPTICLGLESPPVVTFELPNGLTFIFQARPDAETYGLALLARGGSASDADEDLGLTALVSHMLLRGSLSMTGERQARLVESLGATLEPVEGRITVGLRSTGPAEALPRILEVITQAVARPLLDPGDLLRQKEVLRQALRTSLDTPATLLWRRALPVLLPGHPLGRVVDPAQYLLSLDADRVRRAHVERFTGRRTVLTITAPERTADILDPVTRLLGRLPVGEDFSITLARPQALGFPAPHPRVRHRSSQAELLIAAPTPGLDKTDAAAMDILSWILAGANERVYAQLREKRGWAYWVAPVDWRYPGAGLFGVRTAVKKKHIASAEKIILSEIRGLASEAPAAREMDRAVRYLVTARARSWQRSEYRAMTIATAEIRGEPLPHPEHYRRRLEGVTPEQVSNLAGRLLDSSAFATIVLR